MILSKDFDKEKVKNRFFFMNEIKSLSNIFFGNVGKYLSEIMFLRWE